MKMTKKYDDLNDAFDVNNDIVQPEVVEKKIDKIKAVADDIKKDYDYTRGNLYSIIEKGQEALNGVLELAQESEQPRAYEVAGPQVDLPNGSKKTGLISDHQKKVVDSTSVVVLKGVVASTQNVYLLLKLQE